MEEIRELAPSAERPTGTSRHEQPHEDAITPHYVWGGIEHPSSDSSSRSIDEKQLLNASGPSASRLPAAQAEVQFLSVSGQSDSGTSSGSQHRIGEGATSSGSQHRIGESGRVLDIQHRGESNAENNDDSRTPNKADSLPSVGAANHHLGTCKPCFFSCRKTGCDKGYSCEWCHFEHEKTKGKRLSKAKRHRFQDLIEKTFQQKFSL